MNYLHTKTKDIDTHEIIQPNDKVFPKSHPTPILQIPAPLNSYQGIPMTHPIVTRNYPENLTGGIMVCGIDFGFSKEDEKNEEAINTTTEEELSFFSDPNARTTDGFKKRLLTWLDSWGVNLAESSAKIGTLEKSFFQTNWLNQQNRSNKGPVDTLIGNDSGSNADSILNLISERKPKVILFSGSTLIEALNDVRIRNRVEELLGPRPGNATMHSRPAVTANGTVFKVLTQEWPNTTVISTPHATGTFGISNEYMTQFGDLLRPIFLDS